MPRRGTTPAKTSSKPIPVPATQLPETYNKLLTTYVNLVEADSMNPYELSVRRRIHDYFSVKEQLDFVKSPRINDFMKTPNTLAQELPAAKQMLKKLESFDDQAIRAFSKLNSLNLDRLRRRLIQNQVLPGIAFTGSIIGLLLNLQNILAISIKDAFAWLGKLNISLFIQVVILLIIVLAILLARLNWMITSPRIGLVEAFGDILQIMMSHRNLKE